MDDAAVLGPALVAVGEVVRVGDGREDLLEEVERALDGEPPPLLRVEQLGQRATLDQFHDDVVGVRADDVVVDFDDGGVVELRLDVSLALEAVAHAAQVARGARVD